MCCPLANRKLRIKEFEKYPNMVKFYINGGDRYREHHQMFKDIYEWFTCYLFCDSIAEFRERFGANLFGGGMDCKTFLENYFKIKL